MGQRPTEYVCKFENGFPKYKKSTDPDLDFKKFGDIVPTPPGQENNVTEQVKYLNKAAFEWSVGGAFYPGIEMSFVAYDKKTFHEKYDFRYAL